MTRSVVQVCEDALDHEELLRGCNTFVIAVAKEFGYGNIVVGNADSIRGKFSSEATTSSPFHYIGKNPDLATKYATEGHLVIGGLTKMEMTYKDAKSHQHSASMGHVVIVAPGGPSKPVEITLADGRTTNPRWISILLSRRSKCSLSPQIKNTS